MNMFAMAITIWWLYPHVVNAACTHGSADCHTCMCIYEQPSANLEQSFTCVENYTSDLTCANGQVPCCMSKEKKRDDPEGVGYMLFSVFGFIGSIVGFAAFVFYRRHMWRKSDGKVKVRISAAQINKHFPGELIEGEPQCVICLCEITGTGVKLQCGHCYHTECIKTWWTHIPRDTLECPTCKRIQTFSDSVGGLDVESGLTRETRAMHTDDSAPTSDHPEEEFNVVPAIVEGDVITEVEV